MPPGLQERKKPPFAENLPYHASHIMWSPLPQAVSSRHLMLHPVYVRIPQASTIPASQNTSGLSPSSRNCPPPPWCYPGSFRAHPASGWDLQVPPLGLACDKASHLAGSCTVGSFPAGWRPRPGLLLQSGGVPRQSTSKGTIGAVSGPHPAC